MILVLTSVNGIITINMNEVNAKLLQKYLNAPRIKGEIKKLENYEPFCS